jgi:hypothetical protein
MESAIVAVLSATGLVLLAGWLMLVLAYCRTTRMAVPARWGWKRPFHPRRKHREWHSST